MVVTPVILENKQLTCFPKWNMLNVITRSEQFALEIRKNSRIADRIMLQMESFLGGSDLVNSWNTNLEMWLTHGTLIFVLTYLGCIQMNRTNLHERKMRREMSRDGE